MKPITDLSQLWALRASGQRPGLPVLIVEGFRYANACAANGFVALARTPQEPLGERAVALMGLAVAIATWVDFAAWAEVVGEIVRVGPQWLVLQDRAGKREAQWIVWAGRPMT